MSQLHRASVAQGCLARIKGRQERINFLTLTFCPSPKHAFWAPRKEFMGHIPWKERKEGAHIDSFTGIVESKDGSQTGHVGPQKSYYCFRRSLRIILCNLSVSKRYILGTPITPPPPSKNVTGSFLFVEFVLLGLPEKSVTWLPEKNTWNQFHGITGKFGRVSAQCEAM